MNWPSGEIVNVLTFLLPGFVAAAVYYSLTSHPRPGKFDYVVHALIFTALGQALIYGISSASSGAVVESIENWSLAFSVLAATFFALLAAFSTNSDTLHRCLRWARITRETSYPSEWYSAFARHDCYVVLHLKDRRRLYGWPEEWPSQPDRGHFRITWAKWLTEDEALPSGIGTAILVPVDEVKMVEFVDGTVSPQP